MCANEETVEEKGSSRRGKLAYELELAGSVLARGGKREKERGERKREREGRKEKEKRRERNEREKR